MPKQLPRKPRAPTLEERAAARDAELEAVRAALDANPNNEAVVERYRVARMAHASQLSAAEYEARRVRCIELLTTSPKTADAISIFMSETGLGRSQAYETALSCMNDRSVPVEIARIVAAEHLDVLAADAREAKDFVGAVRAVTQAAKFRGVADKLDVTVHRGVDEQSNVPPEVLRLLEPSLARVYALWALAGGRRVFANAELNAFEREGTLPAGLLAEAAHAARALGLPVAEVVDAAPPALTAPEGWRSARPPLHAEKMLGGGR